MMKPLSWIMQRKAEYLVIYHQLSFHKLICWLRENLEENIDLPTFLDYIVQNYDLSIPKKLRSLVMGILKQPMVC